MKEHFGDADGVLNAIGEYWHVVPKRDQVRKWFSRGSIASEWWPILLYVLEMKKGEPVTLAPHCIIGDDNGVFS